jgi:hypothetical protein
MDYLLKERAGQQLYAKLDKCKRQPARKTPLLKKELLTLSPDNVAEGS